MRRELLTAFNEMNGTFFESFKEVMEMYGKEEMFKCWLEYNGIFGYTHSILETLDTLEMLNN